MSAIILHPYGSDGFVRKVPYQDRIRIRNASAGWPVLWIYLADKYGLLEDKINPYIRDPGIDRLWEAAGNGKVQTHNDRGDLMKVDMTLADELVVLTTFDGAVLHRALFGQVCLALKDLWYQIKLRLRLISRWADRAGEYAPSVSLDDTILRLADRLSKLSEELPDDIDGVVLEGTTVSGPQWLNWEDCPRTPEGDAEDDYVPHIDEGWAYDVRAAWRGWP